MGNDDVVSLVQSDNFIIVTSSLLTALLCYDHLLTFDREVRYIWSRGLCGSSLLYFAIRYPSLVYVFLLAYFVGPWEGKTLKACEVIGKAGILGFITVLTAAAIFSGLRAYALCERRRWVLVVVVLLALVNPLTLVIELVSSTAWQIAPFNVCIFQATISAQIYENCQIAARACTIAADMSVLVITWTRTFPEKIGGARMKLRSGIAICMLQDGTIYFGILLIIHVISLALIRELQFVNVMSQWIQAFTAVLACRFILDLHEVAEARFGRVSQHSPTFPFSSIEFRSRDRAQDRRPEDARSVFGATLTWDTRRAAYIDSDDIELDGTTYVASSRSQDTENTVDNV